MSPAVPLVAQGVAIAIREAGRVAIDNLVPGGSVPLRADHITPGWLAQAMGVAAGSIRSLHIVDEHSGTAGRARLAIDSDPQANLPGHVFVKLTPRNYLQRVMMQLFDLGTREVFLYQTLGAELPVRVPHCYTAVLDAARGRNLMVLEDLEHATFRDIRQPLDAAQAEAVIDAMAIQHAAYWASPRFGSDLKTLTGRSPAANLLGDVIRQRFLGTMKGPAGAMVPDGIKRDGRIMFERSADIDAFWASETQTLLHGDPHLGNLFFEGDTVGFIDWQVAISGAGARDVAYFATASVEPDLLRKIERGLVERYVAALASAGVAVDLDHQWDLYRAGVTEFYLSAVASAEAGDRAQDPEICRVGVERSVAAIEALDSFSALRSLVDRATRG